VRVCVRACEWMSGCVRWGCRTEIRLLKASKILTKLGNNNNNKMYRPYNRNTAHVECKNKCDTSNSRGDWDYFNVIQKIREQHSRKTLNQGTPENSHIGHCTHTSESTNVKVQ